MDKRIAIGVLLVLLGACDLNQITGSSKGKSKPLDLSGAMVETFSDSLKVKAGEQARIRCIVSRDREQIKAAPVKVDISPSPGDVSIDGFIATFTATKAGTYSVKCSVPDTEIRDEVGLTITVTPGTPERADTALSVASALAGASVEVACAIYDSFDNLLGAEDLVAEGGELSLEKDSSITQVSVDGVKVTVHGTTAGTYNVACQYGTVVDSSPAALTVLPGNPYRTETTLSEETVRATEAVGVACSVFDAWNNALSGHDTSYQVVAEDNSQPLQNGLVVNDASFSVARSGDYYVFCQVAGFAAGDNSPAVAHVVAGLPFHWEVQILQQDCYWQDVSFPITYDVIDRWGNPVVDPAISVSVIPNTGFTVGESGNLRFIAEGDYDISVTLGGELDSGASASSFQANVRVDSTPPTIAFTSPVRSEMLEAGTLQDSLVDVMGTATDALSPLTSLTVAGQSVDVSGSSLTSSFSKEANSRWGMSIVQASAVDECGNRMDAAHSFFRSPSYLPAALQDVAAARVQTGLLAHLNQMGLDDEYRQDQDDLATLVQNVLGDLDLSDALPQELLFSPETANDGQGDLKTVDYSCDGETVTNEVSGFWVKRNGGVEIGAPVVEYIRAVEDGIKLKAAVKDIVVPLQIHGSLDMECNGGLVETLTGDVRVGGMEIDGAATATFNQGNINVSFCAGCVSVNFEDVTLDFDWGSLGFMNDDLNEMINKIIAVLEEPFEEMLSGVIRSQVGDLSSDFFNDIQVAQSFDIPEPLSMSLSFAAGLDYLKFGGPETAGYVDLGLYTQVYPASRGATIPADAKGPVYRSATLPNFSPAYSFGVGLNDNTLNQVLWALWYGGALAIDDLASMASAAGIDGVALSLDATMPPMLMPGRNGNQVELALGDAFITADVNLAQAIGVSGADLASVKVKLYLSMIQGTRLERVPGSNAIKMVFDSHPEVWVEITEIDSSGYHAQMTDLFTRLMRLVVPNLLSDVFKEIPLPEFNVADFVDISQDSIWSLDSDSISRKEDYFRLTGSMK